MKKIKLMPEGNVVEIKNNESLLELTRRLGLNLKSSCGGHASCGDCVVKILSGEKSLNDFKFEEEKLLGNVFHITKERLACQIYVDSDEEVAAVDISTHLGQANLAESKKQTVVKRKPPVKDEADAEKKIDDKIKNSSPLGRDSGFRRPKKKKFRG